MKRAIAVAALLLLAACGGPSKGDILAKQIVPAHDEVITQCFSYSPKGYCQMWMPVTYHYATDWQFDLRDGDDEGWTSVDAATYDRYSVGDYYGGPR